MSLGLLFIAKMADNALSTVKTIMIQRNRSLLAGVAITLSSFLYFWITRKVEKSSIVQWQSYCKRSNLA